MARPSQLVAAWFKQLFRVVIAISTLGAGFTFSAIFGSVTPSQPRDFDEDDVRRRLAICWLLFVLALGFASFLETFSVLGVDGNGKDWIARAQDQEGVSMLLPSLLSISLQLLLVGAFIAASLAIVPYDRGVGYSAVALVSAAGSILIGIWIMKFPRKSNDDTT